MISKITNLEGEIWVSVFRDYEISNMGRIVSKKYGDRRLLKTCKNNRQYHCVDFMINGKKIKRTVHRLVGLIFVKNLNPLRDTVNHNFGKDDNRASSLCWMTYSENSRHGVDNDLLKRGVNHYSATLDELQVRVIKSMRGELTYQKIADYFKVKESTIAPIMRGESWKHISV